MTSSTNAHVEFDATLDELIDLRLHALRASKVASSWPRVNAAYSAAVTGLLVFLLAKLLAHATLPASLVGASVAAIFAYVLYPLDYNRTLRRRLKRLLNEQFGNVDSVHCQVDLGPDGLRIRQASVEIGTTWDAVRTIENTPDGIEFRFRAGLLLVRNRAFLTASAREQFLALARDLARQAAA